MRKRKIIAAVLSFCMALSAAIPSAMTVFADESNVEQSETISDDDAVITSETESDENSADEQSEENTEQSETTDPELNKEEDTAAAGNFSEDNRVVTVPARSIHLKVPVHNDLVIGETFQIKMTFSPLRSDDYATYYNFHKKVVDIDENGLVTAIGYGTAKIRITTTSGRRANIYFTVTNEDGSTEAVKGEPESIGFVDQNAMIRKGKEVQIEPIIYPLGIYDTLTYSSDNSDVAEVSSEGLVKAVGTGSAVITVTASNGVSGNFSITVYNDKLKGIDVSKWQGSINWKKVASDGVDFAMIRSSYGSEHTDEYLKKNVAGCEKYGIDYGFYHYTYAKTVSEARKEAKYFLSRIKNYDPTYPVVLDIEEEFYKEMSRKKVTDIIVAFMTELEEAGYYATLYSYSKFFSDNVTASRIAKYDIWIASWGDEEKLNDNYDGQYGMWQYSSTGKVDGIDEDVDLNYAFKDYAELIKKNGLNGQS